MNGWQMVFWILGGLLGLILLLILVLLFIKVGVWVQGNQKEIQIRLKVGAVSIPIYPVKKIKQKQTTKEKPKKEKTDSKRHWDVLAILALVRDLLLELCDRMVIEVCRLELVIAGQDAAMVGLQYGRAMACMGMVFPILSERFTIRDFALHVQADFQQASTVWSGTWMVWIRPITILGMLFRHRKEIKQILKQS